MIYTYWYVRYFPHNISDEFINVAVIAGSNETAWHLRELPYKGKVRAFYGDSKVPELWIEELEAAVDQTLDLAFRQHLASVESMNDRARRLNGAVRFSDPNAIQAATASEATEKIAALVRSRRSNTRDRSTRNYVRSTVRDLFQENPNIVFNQNAFQRPRLVDSRGDSVPHTPDFTLGSTEVRLVTDAWGLVAKDSNEFTAMVSGSCFWYERIRNKAVRVMANGRDELNFSDDVQIMPVYGTPRADHHKRNLDTALRIWEQAGVTAISLEDLPSHVEKISQGLIASRIE